MFPVSWEPETRTYRIEAGLIHGVDKGSLFDMYETVTVGTMAEKPLFTLTARSVHPLYAIATINEANVILPEVPRVVRRVRSGIPLKVHFTSAFLTVVNKDKVLRLHDLHRKVKVEHDAASADFVVDVDVTSGKKAVFTTNIKAMTDHGFTRLPKFVPADTESVNRVLLAASRWKQFLEISCDSPSAKNIHVDFFRLETSHNSMGLFTKPMGKKLNGENNLVCLDVKRNYSDYYGMKITNNTERNLHFSMLAFDIGDLDISTCE